MPAERRPVAELVDLMEPAAAPHAPGRGSRGALLVLGVALSAATSAALVGRTVSSLSGNRDRLWILGRAAGLAAYLLLVLLVLLGLVLSHPWRTRLRRPSAATRIRVHVSLAVFTLVFVALHVLVLATDSYAGVGLRGALVPMAAGYRPVPVTMGVLGLYAGLLAGLTAALAGRVTARVWWPIHKVAATSLVLVWVHGVLAGSDSRALLALYVGSAALVVALALSRYAARTPADRVGELTTQRPADRS